MAIISKNIKEYCSVCDSSFEFIDCEWIPTCKCNLTFYPFAPSNLYNFLISRKIHKV